MRLKGKNLMDFSSLSASTATTAAKAAAADIGRFRLFGIDLLMSINISYTGRVYFSLSLPLTCLSFTTTHSLVNDFSDFIVCVLFLHEDELDKPRTFDYLIHTY